MQHSDATNHPLPDQTAGVWFTDPPYYDAIPYSDLSDFFLVWLKRTLPDHPLLCDPFDPEQPTFAQDSRGGAGRNQAGRGPPQGPRVVRGDDGERLRGRPEGTAREDGIGSVVFAHKTTEGWEALLSGMIRGGWTITGSWPIATETRASRCVPAIPPPSPPVSTSSAAHDPRTPRSAIGPMSCENCPRRVGRLDGAACRLKASVVRTWYLLASAPRSRYSAATAAVETADGRHEVELARVSWRKCGKLSATHCASASTWHCGRAGPQPDLAGALEEDARLSALFLWTHQSTDSRVRQWPTDSKRRGRRGSVAATVAGKGFSLAI